MKRMLICALVVMLTACVSNKRDHESTPRFDIRVYSAVPVDLDALDTNWELALRCWERRLDRSLNLTPPYVEIVTKGLIGEAPCPGWWNGEEWVSGEGGAKSIRLSPWLCNARHEFSHSIEIMATGTTGHIYTPCD